VIVINCRCMILFDVNVRVLCPGVLSVTVISTFLHCRGRTFVSCRMYIIDFVQSSSVCGCLYPKFKTQRYNIYPLIEQVIGLYHCLVLSLATVLNRYVMKLL